MEGFAAKLGNLTSNVVYRVPNAAEVDLADAGTFRHRDPQLILTGNSKPNGRECAVIDYRAFFNTIESKTPAFALVGAATMWGQI
jgi:hypothetical protein